MLNNKRLTIVAESILDDVKIASYGAVLNLDDMDLSLTSRYKEVVRADQADFEDFAYAVQDKLASLTVDFNERD